MHNRPILRVLPAPRPLNTVTETGGAQAWTAPVGVTQVAFPQRGAQADAVACAGGGCALMRVGRGYVRARFGGVPVLIAPELAAQIKAVRDEQP